jgi:hypothetical protein
MVEDGSPLETLCIEERGDNFALVRIDADGNKTELVLPEAGLIFLARAIPQTLQKVITARNVRGGSPIIAVPVEHVRVSADMHATDLLLTMIDKFGNETGFAVPLDIARPVAERLITLASEQRSAKLAKQ